MSSPAVVRLVVITGLLAGDIVVRARVILGVEPAALAGSTFPILFTVLAKVVLLNAAKLFEDVILDLSSDFSRRTVEPVIL